MMKITPVLHFNSIISLAVFSALVFVFFNYILANSVEIIDPCSSTPGKEYTWWLILVPFFVAFLWFFLKKNPSLTMENNKNIYVFTTLFIVPMISFFIAFTVLSSPLIQNYFTNINFTDSIYENDCYGDLEINSVFLNGLSALFVFFISLIVFVLFMNKNRSNNKLLI